MINIWGSFLDVRGNLVIESHYFYCLLPSQFPYKKDALLSSLLSWCSIKLNNLYQSYVNTLCWLSVGLELELQFLRVNESNDTNLVFRSYLVHH